MADQPKRKVGYKSPPVEHQFKANQPSANPKGRPPKNKSFRAIVLAQLNRKVIVTQNGKRRRVVVTEVVLQRLAQKAAEGDLLAIREIVKLHQSIAPLKPEPEMSPEEMRERQEMAARLSAGMIEWLEAKAAENKPERRRPPLAPPTDSEPGDSK